MSLNFWSNKAFCIETAWHLMPLCFSIALAKISLPALAPMGLGIALPLILAATVTGVLLGKFYLNVERFLLYLILICWACGTQIFGKPSSIPSLVFLGALHLLYVLQMKTVDNEIDIVSNVQKSFGNIGFMFAILGVIQYGLQYIVETRFAFPVEYFVPKGFLIESFNYLNALSYGSKIFKSNGVFFLEPSFFSQFLAIVLIVELTGANRMLRVAVLLVAMVLTFSGTGILVLGAGLVALTVSNRRWDIVGIVFFLTFIIAAFGHYLGLQIFLERTSEFATIGTSAFERFVSWTYMLADQFWWSNAKVWTGNGAGTFAYQAAIARYSVWESSFAKILFEFGIPGFVFYFSFLIYCIASSSVSIPLKVGLITCIFMNGPYSESNAGLILTLAVWPNRKTITRKYGSASYEGDLKRSISLRPLPRL